MTTGRALEEECKFCHLLAGDLGQVTQALHTLVFSFVKWAIGASIIQDVVRMKRVKMVQHWDIGRPMEYAVCTPAIEIVVTMA